MLENVIICLMYKIILCVGYQACLLYMSIRVMTFFFKKSLGWEKMSFYV